MTDMTSAEQRSAGTDNAPETAPETVVRIVDLKKSFGDNEVLKDISTEVRRGEVVCVIGPSGSGKSTLLRCVNLLEEPTGGKIGRASCRERV